MERFPVDNKCREEKKKRKQKRRINHGSWAWDPVGEIEPESRGWLTKIKRNEGLISDKKNLQD